MSRKSPTQWVTRVSEAKCSVKVKEKHRKEDGGFLNMLRLEKRKGQRKEREEEGTGGHRP